MAKKIINGSKNPQPINNLINNPFSESYYFHDTIRKLRQRAADYEKEQNLKNKNLLKMKFDGTDLNIYNHTISSNGDPISSDTLHVPAYAGANLNGRTSSTPNFDYSKERQKMVDIGPIPEGSYWINPQNIAYNKLDRFPIPDAVEEALNIAGAAIPGKLGTWPGGTPAWGKGRIDIYPKTVDVDGIKRGDFTIHGGMFPGSSGCIDVLDRDVEVFNYLEKNRGNLEKIELDVDYSTNNLK